MIVAPAGLSTSVDCFFSVVTLQVFLAIEILEKTCAVLGMFRGQILWHRLTLEVLCLGFIQISSAGSQIKLEE